MASTTAATPQASSSSPSTTLLLPQTYEARPAGKLQSRTRHSIDLADLTPNNVGQLRKLNSVLFPVKYSQGFYNEALLEERKRVNKLALFNDMPVGNLVCRYEFPTPPSPSSSSSPSSPPPAHVYIMTLGVLAPYRRLGIASNLINHILSEVTPGSNISLPDPDIPAPAPTKNKEGSVVKPERKMKDYHVQSIYLHVQTDNTEAREFYKKLGFAEEEVIDEYYRKGVACRSAVLLRKTD